MRRDAVRPGHSFFLLCLACLAVAMFLTHGTAAVAESIWGMEGIGLWNEGYDFEALGAGSTAIGVTDPTGMSAINPAQAAWAPRAQANFGILTQNRWIRSEAQAKSNRRGDTRLPGIRVILTGPGRLRWAFGYRDLTDGAYHVTFTQNPGRLDSFRRTLRGSGSLGEFSLGLAWAPPASRVAVGAQIGLAQGTLHDTVEDLYTSSAFANTKQTLRTRMDGSTTWALGLQGKPVGSLSLGAMVNGGTDLDLKGIWNQGGEGGWERKATMGYPLGYGLGMAYQPGRRARLSLDWVHRAWADTGFRGSATSQNDQGTAGFSSLRNTDRIGVGFARLPGETSPKDPLLRRSVLRVGLTWAQNPVRQWDPILQRPGETVKEWAVTGGIGLPVQTDRGYVDGLVEIGQTGDLGKVGIRETFLRLGIGVTFSEFRREF